MNKVSKEQFANNAMWSFFEIIVKRVISLLISTIIARLLVPEAYGIVALTTVFITFSDIFLMNGFNVAIVRKERVEADDYSTVMILGLLFSAVVYSLLFLTAPAIAAFYNTPELKNVLRSITILLFFQAISAVIRAKATRELKFKTLSFVSIISSLSSSVVALVLAYKGAGVWALVVQQVLNNAIDVLMLTVFFKWKYSWRFSVSKASEMIKFTMGVLGTSFLDFLGNNANSLIIGKAYNSTELGFYNRGNVYPETIALNTYNSINSVLLPTLASRQNDNNEMKKVVRQVVSLSEYIILPLMIGMIGVSDVFVDVLLTSKWARCVPVMVCACLTYAINPIRSIGYNVFYAKGESNRSIRIEIFRSTAMIINLLITIVLLKQSIYVLAASGVLISLMVAGLTLFQVKKCIGYQFRELFADLLPTAIMCVIMLVVVRLTILLPFNNLIILFLQLLFGTLSYWILSVVTKNVNYKFLKEYVLKKIQKGKLHE